MWSSATLGMLFGCKGIHKGFSNVNNPHLETGNNGSPQLSREEAQAL